MDDSSNLDGDWTGWANTSKHNHLMTRRRRMERDTRTSHSNKHTAHRARHQRSRTSGRRQNSKSSLISQADRSKQAGSTIPPSLNDSVASSSAPSLSRQLSDDAKTIFMEAMSEQVVQHSQGSTRPIVAFTSFNRRSNTQPVQHTSIDFLDRIYITDLHLQTKPKESLTTLKATGSSSIASSIARQLTTTTVTTELDDDDDDDDSFHTYVYQPAASSLQDRAEVLLQQYEQGSCGARAKYPTRQRQSGGSRRRNLRLETNSRQREQQRPSHRKKKKTSTSGGGGGAASPQRATRQRQQLQRSRSRVQQWQQRRCAVPDDAITGAELEEMRRMSLYDDDDMYSFPSYYEEDEEFDWSPARPAAYTLEMLMQELQFRDITPEDYELLMELHEQDNARKTMDLTTHQSLGGERKVEKKKLSETKEGEAEEEEEDASLCCICMAEYVQGDVVRELQQCGHTFHKDCIDYWLSTSSNTCPIDRKEIC